MNLGQLKKNVGFRVQLEPPAIHLDGLGRELPVKNEDWIIQAVTDLEVRIDEATMLPLTTKIGRDSVHHFSHNRARSVDGGPQHGFLTLTLQMYIQEDVITYRPCRPGERLSPLPVQVAEKWVDFKYPADSGLQARLESSGYRVAWCGESRLARLVEIEGWEVVVEKDHAGIVATFHLRTRPENQVFIKTREPDLYTLASNPFFRTQPGLVSCTVSSDARALVFRFSDPVNALMFQHRMNEGASGIRCALAPGRIDTVLGSLLTPRRS